MTPYKVFVRYLLFLEMTRIRATRDVNHVTKHHRYCYLGILHPSPPLTRASLDWIEDSILERNRRLREAKVLYASRSRTNDRLTFSWFISHIRKLLVASQSWFVVSIVGESLCAPFSILSNQQSTPAQGAGIGINAAVISIITEWLSDIKMGYCSDGWWLNQQFCCWELDGDEDSGCDSWHLWSTVSIARWFIYVLFAVLYYSLLPLPSLPHASLLPFLSPPPLLLFCELR